MIILTKSDRRIKNVASEVCVNVSTDGERSFGRKDEVEFLNNNVFNPSNRITLRTVRMFLVSVLH